MEILFGILLGGILTFNAVATPGRAAKEAEKALRARFPDARVNVEIRGKRGRDVLSGHFKSVRVELDGAAFSGFPLEGAAGPGELNPTQPKGSRIGRLELELLRVSFDDLPVERAQLSFDEVRYDFGALKNRSQIRLISFSNGKIALALKPEGLQKVFAQRAPQAQNPRVAFENGDIVMSGTRDILGTTQSFEVRGPVVANGQSIEIGQARVLVSGRALPAFLSAPILKTVNPLYRLDPDEKWPVNVRIESVKVSGDELEAQGTIAARP